MLTGTFLLYLFIILSTTLLATKIQHFKKDGSVSFNWNYFLLAFLIHWFFIAFTRTGADHDQYLFIIEFDAIGRFSMGLEVGFNGLCIILQRLFHNAEIVIWIIKTITLLLFYLGFYLIRKKANLGFVFAAYNAWLYLFSFSILAHSLAISLVVLAAILLLRKENRLFPIVLTIVASTIHASALLLVVVVLGIMIADIIKYRVNWFTVMLLLIVAMVIINNLEFIFQKVVTDVEVFSDYERYNISQNTGGGFFNYIIFVYILICMILPIMKSDMEPIAKTSAVAFYIFSLVSAIMGYYLRSSRLNQYAFTLYGITIPWFLYHIKHKLSKSKPIISYDIQHWTWVLYLIFVTFSSLKSRTDPNGSSEMANYILFNPFTS